MRPHLLLTLIVMMTSLGASAQQSLDEFSISQVGEQLRIKFTLSLGAQCTGVQLYRSIDMQTEEEIGDIAGVCGSASEPVTYYFYDEDPLFHQNAYYRLNMGALGSSHYIDFHALRFNDEDVFVYPNPASDQLKLNIKKPFGSPVELQFVNVNGQISKVFFYSAGDAIDADVAELDRGLYFLKVLVEENVVATKKIILQ